MDAGDFVVRTEHRLEPAAGGLTRIVYRTQITGAAADSVGPELGPQITADFPEVVAEGVDAAVFRAVPDPGALLEMLRTLARGGG